MFDVPDEVSAQLGAGCRGPRRGGGNTRAPPRHVRSSGTPGVVYRHRAAGAATGAHCAETSWARRTSRRHPVEAVPRQLDDLDDSPRTVSRLPADEPRRSPDLAPHVLAVDSRSTSRCHGAGGTDHGRVGLCSSSGTRKPRPARPRCPGRTLVTASHRGVHAVLRTTTEMRISEVESSRCSPGIARQEKNFADTPGGIACPRDQRGPCRFGRRVQRLKPFSSWIACSAATAAHRLRAAR